MENTFFQRLLGLAQEIYYSPTEYLFLPLLCAIANVEQSQSITVLNSYKQLTIARRQFEQFKQGAEYALSPTNTPPSSNDPHLELLCASECTDGIYGRGEIKWQITFGSVFYLRDITNEDYTFIVNTINLQLHRIEIHFQGNHPMPRTKAFDVRSGKVITSLSYTKHWTFEHAQPIPFVNFSDGLEWFMTRVKNRMIEY